MTLSKIMAKLRAQSQGQYRILSLCIFLSVLLVTSFAMMYFSPSMQSLLPEGGDTRKLFWLLFGVICVGCVIFTVYGANLFYKYKSREFGIFLALGEQKKTLKNCLAGELAKMVSRYVVIGVIAAVPVSLLAWKAYQALVISARGIRYRLGIIGIIAGLLFACLLILCILVSGMRFIRRANIIDIMNEQRKTELVKEIKPFTGKLGVILIVAGLFLAMGVPAIVVNLFMRNVPSLWNLTYLISVAGLYMVMLSAVGHKKKGKHPQKYYKNIISANLMRFTARQTTKNMCVITLLIFVFLISSFWGVMYYQSMTEQGSHALYDYSMHYPQVEDQVAEKDIMDLADKHGVSVTSYEECKALNLVVCFTERDWKDDKYFDITTEKLASFLSASDFSRIYGKTVSLNAGEYKTVVQTGYKRTIWVGPDCLTEVKSPETKEAFAPVYKGTVEFDNLVTASSPFTFIISDEDYSRFARQLHDSSVENMIFFNVKDVESTYGFAQELKEEYINRASEEFAYTIYYDAHAEEIARENGKEYREADKIELSVDNPELMGYWKYAPFFKVLIKSDSMEQIAAFLLLAIYVAVISFTAVGIMSYVRSITIAVDNRQLFGDLKKLGADRTYSERVIKNQLNKIFSYPALAASLLSLLFALLLCYFNDMSLTVFEWKIIAMLVLMAILIGVFMYVIYRVAFHKMENIVLPE